MKGLDLSQQYYEAYGKTMLETEFPSLLPFLAVGFVGSGSDRYGFDDDISVDHDFEPGFCIFLPDEETVDRRQAFLLERAYAKLPKEFMGYTRQPLSPVGGNRNGVIRTADFYRNAVGSESGQLSSEAWLHLPDYALAEAVNGKVFFDNYGEFTRIRESLCQMPQDIKLKRLAGNLLLMAQSGPYNFNRCLCHKEPQAAQLACNEFVHAALKVYFLLNDRYCPYYKWSFRALKTLNSTEQAVDGLTRLLYGDNNDPAVAKQKRTVIEQLCGEIIVRLKTEGLTTAKSNELERHAYSVNDRIGDPQIRNLHILAAV